MLGLDWINVVHMSFKTNPPALTPDSTNPGACSNQVILLRQSQRVVLLINMQKISSAAFIWGGGSYVCLLWLRRSTSSLQTVGAAWTRLPERDTVFSAQPTAGFVSSRLKLCSIDKTKPPPLPPSLCHVMFFCSPESWYGWSEHLSLCHKLSVIQLLFCGINSPLSLLFSQDRVWQINVYGRIVFWFQEDSFILFTWILCVFA